jgi:hypothetical protein
LIQSSKIFLRFYYTNLAVFVDHKLKNFVDKMSLGSYIHSSGRTDPWRMMDE